MFRRHGPLLACGLWLALVTSPALANTFTVRSGDNLWSIARAHDITVAELMAANQLSDERLQIGQVLRLPTPAAASALPAAPFDAAVPHVYVVQPGDTLWALARAHEATVPGLMALNGLVSERLRPGQTLRLPNPPVATAAAAPGAAAATPEPAPTSAPAAPAAEPTSAAASPTPAPVPNASYTVRSGDSLYDIARRHGVSVDMLVAWNALDGTLIRPGQVLQVVVPADAPPAAPLVVHVQPGDSLWAIARAHDSTVDAIAAANGLAPGATLRVGLAITIPGRLAAVHATSGATGANVGGPAVTEVRVMPGDNLWKIARQHNTTIAAIMSLNGLSNDRLSVGQSLRVVPGPDLGAASNLTAAAVAPDGGDAMVWPLVGQITSRFGWRRLRIGGTNMHYGLDIDGNVGDPIRSATAGTVTFSGWRGGYGNLVIVENGNTDYYYAHASALIAQVGEQVAPGQVIARVGATGNVTGPHLHFEIRVDGTAIDPLPILEARARR